MILTAFLIVAAFVFYLFALGLSVYIEIEHKRKEKRFQKIAFYMAATIHVLGLILAVIVLVTN